MTKVWAEGVNGRSSGAQGGLEGRVARTTATPLPLGQTLNPFYCHLGNNESIFLTVGQNSEPVPRGTYLVVCCLGHLS